MPEETQIPNQNLIPVHKSRVPTILIIGIILIVIVLAGFWVWNWKIQQQNLANTPENPSPLQGEGEGEVNSKRIYKNETYGFEFEYPRDWNFQLSPYFNETDQSILAKLEYLPKGLTVRAYSEPGNLGIAFEIYADKGDETIERWAREKEFIKSDEEVEELRVQDRIVELDETEIAGKTSLMYMFGCWVPCQAGGDPYIIKQYFIPLSPNKILRVSASTGTSGYETTFAPFDRLIESFKFTE